MTIACRKIGKRHFKGGNQEAVASAFTNALNTFSTGAANTRRKFTMLLAILILFHDVKYKSIFSIVFDSVSVAVQLPPTVSGLAKVAIVTTNVDAENQRLINHKTVCGAMNRHFCQTRVSGSLLLSVHYVIQFSYSTTKLSSSQ